MSEEMRSKKDSIEFANDLYFFLFTKVQRAAFSSSLPLFKTYFRKSRCDGAIAKAVLYMWYKCRHHHRLRISKLQPENSLNGREYLKYLESACKELYIDERVRGCENVFMTVLAMCGQLFESCVYLLEKEHACFGSFVFLIPMAWSRIFGLHYEERFFAEGGWEKLKLKSVEYSLQCELTGMNFPGEISTKKDLDFSHADQSLDRLDTTKLSRKLQWIRYKFSEQLQRKMKCEGMVPRMEYAIEPSVVLEDESQSFEVQHKTSSSQTAMKHISLSSNIFPLSSEHDVQPEEGSEAPDDSRKSTQNTSPKRGDNVKQGDYEVPLCHPLNKSLLLLFKNGKNIKGSFVKTGVKDPNEETSTSNDILESQIMCCLQTQSYIIILETVMLREKSPKTKACKLTNTQFFYYSLLFFCCVVKFYPLPDTFALYIGDTSKMEERDSFMNSEISKNKL